MWSGAAGAGEHSAVAGAAETAPAISATRSRTRPPLAVPAESLAAPAASLAVLAESLAVPAATGSLDTPAVRAAGAGCPAAARAPDCSAAAYPGWSGPCCCSVRAVQRFASGSNRSWWVGLRSWWAGRHSLPCSTRSASQSRLAGVDRGSAGSCSPEPGCLCHLEAGYVPNLRLAHTARGLGWNRP